MANMFDENGNYNKTEWKPGDRITAGKLNKIEESLEAINNNDIERHKEADERLDALEEQKEAVEERFDELEDLVADNKSEVDTAIYEVHSKMDRLEQEMNDGIDTVEAIAHTVDDKIADADASMKDQVAEVEADLEGLHAKDEELSEQLADIENNHLSISIKDFGAKGDGITDDTEAIKNAISQVSINKIYLPQGVYVVSDTIVLRNGIELYGDGELYQPIEYVNKDIIKTKGDNKISGITIRGSITDSFLTIAGAGIVCDGDNIIIENCKILGKAKGIFGDNTYGHNTTIKNNEIYYTQYGIYLTYPQDLGFENRKRNIKILENLVLIQNGYKTDNATSQHIRGIVVWNGSASQIINNRIFGSELSFESRYSDGLMFSNNTTDTYVSIVGNNTTCINNIIDRTLRPEISCFIPNGYECGIEFVGNNQIVSNNYVRGTKKGIASNNTSLIIYNSLVSNNIIIDCDFGIWTRGVHECSISNNKITNAVEHSICSSGSEKYPNIGITITGNVIDNDNTPYANGGGALWVYGCRDVYISNNNIQSNLSPALSIGLSKYSASNVIVDTNKFISNSEIGIRLNAMVLDIIIKDNIISSTDSSKVINGVYNAQSQAKIMNNIGFIPTGAIIPIRGTWNVGERIPVYNTNNADKLYMICTNSGTGYDSLPDITVSSQINSNIITFEYTGATLLNVGQYISLEGSFSNAKILSITLNYEESDLHVGHGGLIGGSAIISATASNTMTGVLTFTQPTFILI